MLTGQYGSTSVNPRGAILRHLGRDRLHAREPRLVDSVDAVSPTAADLTLGRRLKALLIGLLLLAVVIVAVARVNWHFLGRITVAATESGDRIAVSVSSLSGRP